MDKCDTGRIMSCDTNDGIAETLSKSQQNWNENYEALKAHVMETGHFPNKHDRRLNWYKYNAKLIKQGKLAPEREQLIHDMENMRSHEHTGGRKRKPQMQASDTIITNQ